MGLEASFRLIFLTNNFGLGIFLVSTWNLGDFWSLGTWATWLEPTASLDPRGIYNSGHLLFFFVWWPYGIDLVVKLCPIVRFQGSASSFGVTLDFAHVLVRGQFFLCVVTLWNESSSKVLPYCPFSRVSFIFRRHSKFRPCFGTGTYFFLCVILIESI